MNLFSEVYIPNDKVEQICYLNYYIFTYFYIIVVMIIYQSHAYGHYQ